MSSKTFIVFVSVLVLSAVGFIVIKQKNKPAEIILGNSHEVQKSDHIGSGQKHEPYNSDLPSSGPHYADSSAPAQWGVYVQEVPDEVFIHNQEHGGVIVAYKPDTPADQIQKLQKLFAPPFSNPKFTPSKALLTPRTKNTRNIQLASWGWTLNLDNYDEEAIIKFYNQHVGKAPEAGAGPSNTPIDQSASQ